MGKNTAKKKIRSHESEKAVHGMQLMCRHCDSCGPFAGIGLAVLLEKMRGKNGSRPDVSRRGTAGDDGAS